MTVNTGICHFFPQRYEGVFFLVGPAWSDQSREIHSRVSHDLRPFLRLRVMWFSLLFISFFSLHAKVDPPNYDFSVDTLAEFFPGKELAPLESKYGKPEVLTSEGERRTLRFQVAQLRYHFPVVVQAEKGKVLDMHATMPSYFLHDVFHQSLINRWGKQQKYKRVDEEAFYEWVDPERIMRYGASCTITCFPIYFSVFPPKEKAPSGFKPLSDVLAHPQSR